MFGEAWFGVLMNSSPVKFPVAKHILILLPTFIFF